MAVWTTIPDSAVAPNAPITSGLMTALRDNIQAFAEGAAGAPKISPTLLTPGGVSLDGAISNSSVLTSPGFYDFSTGSITSAKALAWGTVVRITGDFTLSAALTVANAPANASSSPFSAVMGGTGQTATSGSVSSPSFGSGGGGSVGAGGSGSGGTQGGAAILGLSSMHQWWIGRRYLVGGISGMSNALTNPALGGGFLVLIIDGDFHCVGGSITANGANNNASTLWNSGGGGGGFIFVFCTGTITSGTFTASGGVASSGGGGGGGGAVVVVTSAIGSTIVTTANGGAGTNGNGGAGLVSQISGLTPGTINSLLAR